jgi:hypothetical protein
MAVICQLHGVGWWLYVSYMRQTGWRLSVSYMKQDGGCLQGVCTLSIT